MTIKNAYPELPEVPYKKTIVTIIPVIAFLQGYYAPVEVVRAAYVFFRIESANGTKGVNNNYAGIQADGARWPDEYTRLFVGTSVLAENKTNKQRRFIAFATWQDSVRFTLLNIERRGMYIGGETWRVSKLQVNTLWDLAAVYKKEWVTGNPKALPTDAEFETIKSIYKQAEKLFPDPENK